jgi:hypothetical protein
MIDVTCYSNDEPASSAEAPDAEAALLAARCLWDEAFNGTMGQRRALVFEGAGLLRRLEVRP